MAVKKTKMTDVLWYLDNVLTVGGHAATDLFQMHCEFIEKQNKLMGDDAPIDEIEAQAYVEGLSGLYERLNDEAKARSHIIDMIKARKTEERPVPAPEPPEPVYELTEPVYELSDFGKKLFEKDEAMKKAFKRGRPRKAEERHTPKPEPVSETPTKKKRGRPRKVAK